MILRRIFPGEPESIDLADASSRPRLLELYRPPRAEWLRLNLITTVSGSAGGSDGTSETLTNAADRRLLGVIRELSDVVLIGANSLRTEGYLLPKRSRLAVVTSSGNLAGHSVDQNAEADAVVVLCPASAVHRVRESLGPVRADVVEIANTGGRMSPVDIVSALRSLGLASIVCEGGPSLAAQLLLAGVVDELCLSTSPVLNGAALAPFGREYIEAKRLGLRQLMVDDESGLYARWAFAQ